MPSRPNPIRPKPFINRTRVLFLILTISSSLVIFFAIIYFIYHLWISLLNRSRTIPFYDVGASPSKLQLFSYKELKLATNDFDESNAKISDFGLSRVKVEGGYGIDLFSQDLGKSQELSGNFGGESTPQTAIGTPTAHEVDFALALQASSSSKNSRTSRNIKAMNLNSMSLVIEGETKGKEVSNDVDDGSKVNQNVLSCEDHEFEQSKEMNLSPNSVLDVGKGSKQWGRDWWWKQEGSGELCSKDYVREWIGSQIHTVNPDWDDEKKIINTPELGVSTRTIDKAEDRDGSGLNESRFDTLEEKFAKEEISERKSKKPKKKKKHRNMEEWWKEEEHQDEMKDKKKFGVLRIKLKNRLKVPHFRYCFRGKGENSVPDREGEAAGEFSFRRGWRRKSNSSSKKKKNNNTSMGSEMWSGDLFSRELSSTTSMRGTLCYIAPEYGGGCCYLMEKGDIYSFGVLILVIVSGRRPLHVLASPMKLEKANLVSWCRQLAQSGNVLELVDERLKEGYNKEEAGLCINLALACLQKTPELRPDISEAVRILRGEMEISSTAFEFSPSPPAKFYGSRSKRRS
ncbi:unnamed protein product, partial [Thlaspi arvense]